MFDATFVSTILWLVVQAIFNGVRADTTAPRNNIVAVAAIDLGTARSGWAFSLKGEPGNMYMIGDDRQKVPTSIILKETGDGEYEYTHFGKEAESFYEDAKRDFATKCEIQATGGINCEKMVEEGLWDDDVYFFDKFKMALYDKEFGGRVAKEGVKHDIAKEISAKNGKMVPSKIVIREALRFMKDRVFERLEPLALGETYKEQQIQWVITVPGMWSEEAKKVMKQAAYDAGMGKSGSNLMLALEPEAASLEVRSQFKNRKQWKAGMKYCVVDAGGGTIDFVCHKLNDELRPEETHFATGDKWGSTYLDQAFEDLMKSWFNVAGFERWEKFKKKESAGYLKLIRNWEVSKKKIKHFADDGSGIGFPASASEHFGLTTIKDICKDKTGDNYCYVGGTLRLPKHMIEKMYLDLITPTVDHIKTLLESPEVKGTEYLFLVGGFGQSEVLKEALTDAFSPLGITVVRPNYAGNAVLFGAVRFGHNPTQIAARRSKETYGTNTCVPWTSECPVSKTHMADNRKYCCEVFSLFVRKNQLVKTDEAVEHSYNPLEDNQKSMRLGLFSSSETHPEYVDHSSVSKRGEIVVDMSHNSGRDRTVDLKMMFGSTIVNATAHHEGKMWGAEIVFEALQLL